MTQPVEEAKRIGKQYLDEQSLNPFPGNRAYLWQRLTGVGITGYLFMHMIVIGSIARGPQTFDKMLGRVTHPAGILAPLEFLLLLVIAFHALNGVRVTVLEFNGLAKHHRVSVLVMMAAFVVLAVVGAILFFPRVFAV
jgi:succinate dehydrogenase / fumarate reductase, cytochrome b subunit